MRALTARHEAAVAWIRRVEWGEIAAAWPELAYAEIANGLRTLVHTKAWSKADANDAMARAMEFPVKQTAIVALAPAALELALDRRLTPYDACYVVLAELMGATLVTADRRMAKATRKSLLI